MPNFDVRVAFGASLVEWTDPDPDPSGASKPSRLRPHPGLPFLRWLGAAGVPIELRAIVDGLEAPLDSSLGGNLFTGWFAEEPMGPHAMTQQPGQTSVIRFVPVHAGHYTVGVRRTNGGAILLHIDVN